jgi:hypothetical protein
MRIALWSLFLASSAFSQAKPPPATAASDEFKPVKVLMVPQDSMTPYQAQLLGDLDRPVGDGLTLGGVVMPAKLNDKGALELDARDNGKIRTLSGKHEIVSVAVQGEGEKPKSITVKLEFHKREDGTWVYRNLTTLHVQIGTEQFVIVDANGNGSYSDERADGIVWEGRTWLFPLPGEHERWCSATMEFTGLQFGPVGENPSIKGKALATTVAGALGILKGINEERVEIGLTPRPEDVKLSSELQKHCKYMAMNNILTHPEESGKPGYTEEGNKAGMRSILGRGQSADNVAAGMVTTYFHRQDVIRPATTAFGVGIEGAFTGIDGRSSMGQAPAQYWPVLCPVPGQTGVGTTYGKEAPDATPGDNSAGYPITVYFGTSSLKLKEGTLKTLPPGAAQLPPGAKSPPGTPVDCYLYDPQQGASADFTKYQSAVCMIPKDPLKVNVDYEVSMTVDVNGKPWSKTWRFSTSVSKSSKDRMPGR